MFNAHRERKEAAERQSALEAWREQVHELQYLLQIAQGQTRPNYDNLILKPGEAGVFASAASGSLRSARVRATGRARHKGYRFPSAGSPGGRCATASARPAATTFRDLQPLRPSMRA